MAKKRPPRQPSGEHTGVMLSSQQRSELIKDAQAIRNAPAATKDGAEAQARRLIEIEERLMRANWTDPLTLAELNENAPPRVRGILLAFTQLSPDEWRNLSSRMHHYIHPECVIQSRVEWEKDQRALHRMTSTVMYETMKPKKADKDAKLKAKIIKLWNGGRKKNGRSAEGVRLELESEYPQLTRGSIAQIIHRHKKELEKRRKFGL